MVHSLLIGVCTEIIIDSRLLSKKFISFSKELQLKGLESRIKEISD